MYNLRYKGVHLPRTSEKLCGGEFKGDCFAFATKYLDMYWIQANGYTNKTVDKTRLPSRPCEKDEVTSELWPNDYLFVCGPYKQLTLFGNFNVLPYHTISFKIQPKDDKSEIINFEIQKYQKNRIPDFSIIGEVPIISKPKYYGRYQLENGW